MKYQAVFFDFDYTLGDATTSIYEGFVYAFGQMGYPTPGLENVRRTVGHMLEDEFTMLTGETDPARRAEFRHWFREKVGNTQAKKTLLLPGAEELLRALKDAGVKVGVITSKWSTTLGKILARYNLLELMSYTVGGENVSRPKPDPEGLNGGMAALGLAPTDVLYCGDTVIDAETAQRAGVDFSAVLNGTTPAEDFTNYPNVHVAPDLLELRVWLGL
ncbi:MAG: HAD family hydrolase [Pseudoflavonifractor sp.]|nr:HAD family hydrolase [Pseudoflavonifractor sp.]